MTGPTALREWLDSLDVEDPSCPPAAVLADIETAAERSDLAARRLRQLAAVLDSEARTVGPHAADRLALIGTKLRTAAREVATSGAPEECSRTEHATQQRARVSAALVDQRVIRTLFGRRALDAPEMQAIAWIAVDALRGSR